MNRLAAIVLPLLSMLLPGLLYAEQSAVRVEVTVIHASNDGDEVDPRLEDLKRQLSSFDFSAFRLLDTHVRTLALAETGEFSLPGDRLLTITPRSRDQEGRLRVHLSIGGVIDTTYTIAEGASLIVGGPRHDGGHLILAVNQTSAR